jgi:choline kinase
MLRTLLTASEPNAVIVDRHVHAGSDMMKAQMAGRQIMRMSKQLAPEFAAAEVVGPAKFSAAGAQRIIQYLDEVIGSGERGRWAYDVFGTLAEELRFSGLDNPGCFWSEIDTPEDAERATQRMPRALVDFVAERAARAGVAVFSTARRDSAHADR